MATYLAKTFGSAGNQRTWTWSGWVKLTGGGADETIFSGGIGLGASGNRTVFRILSGEAEKVMVFSGNTSQFAFKTSASLRDKSAWYHFVLAMDTTQATASNRFKMYINGSQVTDTAQLTYPSQNLELGMNNNEQQYIGLLTSDNNLPFNGYMADVYFIDGTQLTAASFGETDSTTGIWIPKTYSGSYGTNGYRLEFKNSGALGTDTSGNSNTWTVNNAGTGAQVVDTPSNVFSTFNPLIERPLEGPATFAQGALQASGTSKMAFSSIALPSSGKWYAEFKATAGTSIAYVGLRDVDDFTVDGNSNRLFYRNDGQKDTGSGESSYGNSWTTNDIISIAANVDDSEVTFYKNGTAQDGGTAISQNCANQYFFVATGGGWSFQANFGNPSFSISSGNADANGYGNFEYAVPSGYYALCTENLNTYG
jgi:hypothetical protein